MAEAAKDSDQSMEEILQSIKRIIAEEGDPNAPAAPPSDVLELTDMLADDGSVSTATKEDAPPAVSMMSIDEIMAAPVSSEAAPAPAPAPAPEPTPAPAPAPVVDTESLISETTRAASAAALRELDTLAAAPAPAAPTTAIPFRSGETVESLVIESLKPMLKDWLDSNLPGMVERLVEKEIRKLSAR